MESLDVVIDVSDNQYDNKMSDRVLLKSDNV